jgi:tRNA 2-selenouridine synthase
VRPEKIHIREFLKRSENQLILDVRSPAEYAHAHIPGAISFPLFSNEERAVVGTAYKQQSREHAIRLGLDFFGPKMRPMVDEAERLLGMNQENSGHPGSHSVFVYCWRGGMRSSAVAWLLDMYGFKVTLLSGGYKSFRNFTLQTFEQPFAFRILGGYTGSGKTEVLKALGAQGETIIDLEELAAHRGSAFGGYNMPPPPTQEMFENMLGSELRKKSGGGESNTEKALNQLNTIWLEDESQRIGNINLPKALWETMRSAPVVFLDIPFEERLGHVLEEYSQTPVDSLISSAERIRKRLGPLETKNTIAFLEEGNIREAFRILLHYYDKQYLKGLNGRQGMAALVTKISCEKATALNSDLITKFHTV